MNFTNARGTDIQCNVDKDFVFSFNNEEVTYNIKAGEDGVIKLSILDKEEYLSQAIDKNGWLIQIEDVYMLDENNTIIISSDGVIAIYKKEKENTNPSKEITNAKKQLSIQENNFKYIYNILLENSECYYDILEAKIEKNILTLKVKTEFSGVKSHSII